MVSHSNAYRNVAVSKGWRVITEHSLSLWPKVVPALVAFPYHVSSILVLESAAAVQGPLMLGQNIYKYICLLATGT
jgi:hypothetical protein